MHCKRDYCQPLLSFSCRQCSYLFFSKKQPARALRLVIFWRVAGLVGRYAHAHNIGLATPHYYVRSFQLAVAAAQTFYLMAKKLDPSIELLLYLVLEPRLFVLN